MDLRFAPLFSGSSGNSTYVGTDEGGLLIDAGVSGVRILRALESLEIAPDTIRGILVTHEHSDHISSVGTLARKLHIPVYATAGTWSGMEGKVGKLSTEYRIEVEPNTAFSLSGMEIVPFSIPHDAAEPCGYSLSVGASVFTLATDIGCVREEWLSWAKEAGAVLLESNYDPDMLTAGPYPYDLKKRILSRKGHLSNDDSAKAALQLANAGVRHIVLGHLSKENNFPELALRTSELTLSSNGIELDSDVRVCVASRDEPTGLYSVSGDIVCRWI